LTLLTLLVPLTAFAQAPGLPLVAAPRMASSSFFVEADAEWASTRLNGNREPTEFEKSFLPRLAMGWAIKPEQIVWGQYRFLNADANEGFNVGVPDLESHVERHVRVNMVDLMYRECLGGEGAPFGLSVDMGTRFAWAYFKDHVEAQTIAGPNFETRDLNFYTFGGRVGGRLYWAFDQSAWQMTLYGQANGSYLWGQFRDNVSYNPQTPLNLNASNKNWDTIWNYDLEAGLSSYIPGFEGVLQLTLGYRYEVWAGERLGFMTGGGTGQLTSHGPMIRLQWTF
jgi:hypothetical protein